MPHFLYYDKKAGNSNGQRFILYHLRRRHGDPLEDGAGGDVGVVERGLGVELSRFANFRLRFRLQATEQLLLRSALAARPETAPAAMTALDMEALILEEQIKVARDTGRELERVQSHNTANTKRLAEAQKASCVVSLPLARVASSTAVAMQAAVVR